MKKVWKLNTGMTEKENRKFVTQTMSKEDHDEMLELNLNLSLDLLEEDIINSFIICDDFNIEKVKSLLLKYNINFTVEDVTYFFLDEGLLIDDINEDIIFNKLGI